MVKEQRSLDTIIFIGFFMVVGLLLSRSKTKVSTVLF
jgi:hypothetical protein